MIDDVVQLHYSTTIACARYHLQLTRAAVRVDLTLHAPYIISVGETWHRVACVGVDYTGMLDQTTAAITGLRGSRPQWRITTIASERGGFISAYAHLRLDHLCAEATKALRDALPRGVRTNVQIRYERPAHHSPPPPAHTTEWPDFV